MKTKHICFTRNAAFGSVATLLTAAVAFPAPAFADLCHRPHVMIYNEKDDDMEVKKIRYFDGCQQTWRTEEVPKRIIPHGDSTTYTDDLEYVEGCPIEAFELYRRVDGNWGWTSYIWGNNLYPDEGSNVECYTGTYYTLHNR